MAPLPQNNTARVFFDYVTGVAATSQEHTCAVRYSGSGTTVAQVQAGFLSLLEAIGAPLFRIGWKVTGVRVQAANSNFSLPVAIDPDLLDFEGTASGDYQAADEASQVTFVGRSPTTGRRASLSLFTAVIGPGENFRFLDGSSGINLSVRNALLTLASEGAGGVFMGIDGQAPQWYPYMNMNYNSYWETEVRG